MKTNVISALALSFVAGSASAHASLDVSETPPETSFKFVMRVTHGCDGQATHTVKIDIPEGLVSVKPMPKAGWDVSVETGPYARSYEDHGPKSEGAKSITWTNGSLEDWQYDEFVFRGYVSDAFAPGDTVYIPVVQTCEGGENAWVELPQEGQPRPAHPAPTLSIIEGAGHSH